MMKLAGIFRDLDARTDAQTDTRMEGVYNLSTTTCAFHGLSLQSEAIAPIIREKFEKFCCNFNFY